MKNMMALFLLISALTAGAQVPDHVPLMTSTWDLLAMKSYQKNPAGVYAVYFPPDLKEMDKKAVELPGYMIPIKAGFVHPVFMLSVLPVLQCQFCGQADIPSMVEVRVAKPALYVEKPILIKGILNLNSTDNSRSEFIITNATVEELK